MGARYVERFDAARGAEKVFRGLSVECVGRQCFAAGQQLEAIRGYDQVQVAGLAADGAVAFRDLQVFWRYDFELHSAAVAPARVLDHERRHSFRSGSCGLKPSFTCMNSL